MLLPAKFQTPTPAPLGAKVVAIAPAPKPHVHQWVSVPDSKIHSRCAECGTVTLTEIVAPKVVAYDPRTFVSNGVADALRYAVGALFAAPANKTGAEFRMKLQALDAELRAGEAAMKARAPAPEISDSALTAAVHDFLAGSADRTLAKTHARSVLDEMGYKNGCAIPQHRRAEFLKALTTRPQEPAKHYTSITAPDGRVRMVETDAEGWIKNDGTQPVADAVRVEVRVHDRDRPADMAVNFHWGHPNFTHYRVVA